MGPARQRLPPFILPEPWERTMAFNAITPPTFKLRLMEAINQPSSRLDAGLNRPSIRPLSAPARPVKLTADTLLSPFHS